MANTTVTICNRALSRIGHTILISSLTESRLEAEQCNLHFEPSRDAVLEDHPWSFATKRVELAELASVERTDWEYVYAAPSDMLVARHIVLPGTRNPASDSRIPYVVEANDAGDGQVILTDQEDAELLYTTRHTAVAVWPQSFVDALTWRLAIELALGIKKDRALAGDMAKGYQAQLVRAAVNNANQGQRDLAPLTPSIGARR